MMVVSQTPLRISFFGGGTDYRPWVEEHGGAVLSTSINRYSYISCRDLLPFFDYKYLLSYSKIEMTETVGQIEHPAIRAVLHALHLEKRPLAIHYTADLPAKSGLGSSSSFTVGLLQALLTMMGRYISKMDLARLAIDLEQGAMGETVGAQDQTAVAFGGLNRIDFFPDSSLLVTPVVASDQRIKRLESSLLLFFTGFSRIASEVAKAQVDNMKKKEISLHRMQAMVDEAMEILQNERRDLSSLGHLLHETWQEKRGLSEKISTPAIDAIYAKAKSAGALGGKLLGAGGGGFILFFVDPERRQEVIEALKPLLFVPFSFESRGSRIILSEKQRG